MVRSTFSTSFHRRASALSLVALDATVENITINPSSKKATILLNLNLVMLRISAIKPIFAIFWDFDGVGQVIPTNAYFRKVWI